MAKCCGSKTKQPGNQTTIIRILEDRSDRKQNSLEKVFALYVALYMDIWNMYKIIAMSKVGLSDLLYRDTLGL